ncbi:aminotransferase class V-fold PLP-dependent enzyme [bacterium]|nr:aminotransferase class V-fold PLP-dependent enzyme [bacterium]
MKTIYLDYNATTPLDPEVREAMMPFLGESFGNPSSIHHVGRRVRAFLDEARERVSVVWQCKPSEVIFTSGGTESNNMAIFGVARLLRDKGRHLITSQIEHHAVLHCFDYLRRKEGFEVTYLPVDQYASISPEDLKAAFRPDTVLVSLMAANNEVGTIQRVADFGSICRDRGVIFHTDAVQWFGKEPFESIHQFNADLVSCCSHKFHGPKGGGALFVRSPLHPDPLLFGGAHENERRAGTENVPAIAGFAKALELFVSQPVFARSLIDPLTLPLINSIGSIPGCSVVSPASNRLCNTIAFTVDRSDGLTVLANLDMDGICASSGSACSAGSLEPSHVIAAMGYPTSIASNLVRFSLGRDVTEPDISDVCSLLPQIISCSQTPV